jgi:hypothetical protein
MSCHLQISRKQPFFGSNTPANLGHFQPSMCPVYALFFAFARMRGEIRPVPATANVYPDILLIIAPLFGSHTECTALRLYAPCRAFSFRLDNPPVPVVFALPLRNSQPDHFRCRECMVLFGKSSRSDAPSDRARKINSSSVTHRVCSSILAKISRLMSHPRRWHLAASAG